MVNSSRQNIAQIARPTDKQHKAELRQILQNLAPAYWRNVPGTGALVMRLVDLAQTCRPGKRDNAPVISSARTSNGQRAIHLLAGLLKADYCGMLIARGVSVGSKTEDGDTAAHYVAMHNMIGDVRTREVRIVNVLATAGVDIDARNRGGHTPLQMACSRGKVGVVAALLGAQGERAGWERSMSLVINDKKSPLWWAARYGHVEIVRMLCGEFRPKVMVMHDPDSSWHANLESWARKEGHDDILGLIMTLPVVRECWTCGRMNVVE